MLKSTDENDTSAEAPNERLVISAEAVCGNCGNQYSKHYSERYGDEDRVYCNTTTNGDIFSDTPSDDTIFDMILKDHSGMYNEYLERWRKTNKHL